MGLLVNAFKSAAQGYGIEKRVLLLHGPVGSSKSTIARLLKKGLERYSTIDEGAMYTLGWSVEGNIQWCPMNEEPLHLVPERFREEVANNLNAGLSADAVRSAAFMPSFAPSAAMSIPTCASITAATGRAWCKTCASSG